LVYEVAVSTADFIEVKGLYDTRFQGSALWLKLFTGIIFIIQNKRFTSEIPLLPVGGTASN